MLHTSSLWCLASSCNNEYLHSRISAVVAMLTMFQPQRSSSGTKHFVPGKDLYHISRWQCVQSCWSLQNVLVCEKQPSMMCASEYLHCAAQIAWTTCDCYQLVKWIWVTNLLLCTSVNTCCSSMLVRNKTPYINTRHRPHMYMMHTKSHTHTQTHTHTSISYLPSRFSPLK